MEVKISFLSPSRIVAIIVAAIFVAETIIMSVIFLLPISLSPILKMLFDAAALCVIVLPFLLAFIYRPIVRYITELKQAEETLRESEKKYQDLYNNAPDMYFTVRQDGIVTSVSQSGAEYLGYRVEELVGGPVWVVVHPEDLAEVQRQMAAIFQDRRQENMREFRKVRKDGSVLWVQERIQVMPQDNGVSPNLYVICRDITERKQAEETLHRTRDELETRVQERTAELVRINRDLSSEVTERLRAERELQELNETLEQRVAQRAAEAKRRAEELEQFAYVASHDLKAPLRGVANLAAWLQEDLAGKLNNETGEQLAFLQDRVGRMHTLIEGLLEYSRVGRIHGTKETVDTGALLAEIIDLLSLPTGVVVDVAPDMPTLHTDRLLLSQVFANLVGNAIKHHEGSQAHVWVTVRDAGRFYEFSVADDGPGIAPQYHQKVFMMFQTLAPRDMGADSGIGLALVKKIVEEHGGSITLDSEVGKGSTFRFTWPK